MRRTRATSGRIPTTSPTSIEPSRGAPPESPWLRGRPRVLHTLAPTPVGRESELAGCLGDIFEASTDRRPVKFPSRLDPATGLGGGLEHRAEFRSRMRVCAKRPLKKFRQTLGVAQLAGRARQKDKTRRSRLAHDRRRVEGVRACLRWWASWVWNIWPRTALSLAFADSDWDVNVHRECAVEEAGGDGYTRAQADACRRSEMSGLERAAHLPHLHHSPPRRSRRPRAPCRQVAFV